MRLLIIFGTILLLTNCNSTPNKKSQLTDWSFVGSWYTDLQDGGGVFDSVMNYAEIYINDSTLYYQEERMGQSFDQDYFIKNDTIYKCFGTGEECEFIPIYRIEKFTNDTLWLTVNKEYTKRDPRIYWVKLPKDEKGHFDHVWTKENSDSLKWAVVYDYDRRKYKYYATLGNNLEAFDSMVRAGTWKWDMKEIEQRKREE